MKPPYFPEPRKPKDTSPYRESQPSLETESSPPPLPANVVSRPEPPPEDAAVKAELTRLEARALLTVERNQRVTRFRARIGVVAVTLILWRSQRLLGALGWIVYPMLVVSLVVVVLEIKHVWKRTEL